MRSSLSLVLIALMACGGSGNADKGKGAPGARDSGQDVDPVKTGDAASGTNRDGGTVSKPDGPVGALRAGFAKQIITPKITDTWTDTNQNGKKDDDEPHQDGNGNGRFDPYWLAGFHQNRPATGVHDDIFAVACVIDNGKTRIAIVALDAIGFMFDQVEEVRGRIAKSLEIDHVVVLSTHNHEVPDLMGIWGPGLTETGIIKDYMELVQSRAALAVADAVKALEPAELRVFEAKIDDVSGMVVDTRTPLVSDPDLRALQFVNASGNPVGQIVSWANHPEVLWSNNLEITADFVGYLRDGIDKGLRYGDELKRPGIGGTTLFVNGAIGGLLTPLDSLPIQDPHLGTDLTEPSHDKARALGYQIAARSLDMFAGEPVEQNTNPALEVFVERVELPVANTQLRLASQVLGILPRKVVGDAILGPKVASEMNLIELGGAVIVTVPGEVYPEIVNGGVESPEGGDFAGEIVETPAWREQMQGNVKFVFGLANDSIGYIVPRTQWDEASPHTYEGKPYGEGNSLGPDTAPILHETLKKLVTRAAK